MGQNPAEAGTLAQAPATSPGDRSQKQSLVPSPQLPPPPRPTADSDPVGGPGPGRTDPWGISVPKSGKHSPALLSPDGVSLGQVPTLG